MSFRVVFAPEAEAQLLDIYRYIAHEASPEVALRYTDAIMTHCESLRTLPLRGTRRDDIRPGLRITSYRRRITVAFSVEADLVSILGIFYAGRDYEAVLQIEDELS